MIRNCVLVIASSSKKILGQVEIKNTACLLRTRDMEIEIDHPDIGGVMSEHMS